MPICKLCNKRFPNKIKIDGKVRTLSSRSYCLECSPFGKHNTRPVTKELLKLNGKKYCTKCKKNYPLDVDYCPIHKYSKGNNKGEPFKLKIRRSKIHFCKLGRNSYKKAKKLEGGENGEISKHI